MARSKALISVNHKKWTVTKSGLNLVRRMAAEGCTLASIAGALGMSPKRLREIRQRDDPVQTAIDLGRGVLGDELTS